MFIAMYFPRFYICMNRSYKFMHLVNQFLPFSLHPRNKTLKLIPCRRVLKNVRLSLSNCPHFMKCEHLLPCFHQPTTGSWLSQMNTYFFKIHFNILPSISESFKWAFCLWLSEQHLIFLVSSMCATCFANFILEFSFQHFSSLWFNGSLLWNAQVHPIYIYIPSEIPQNCTQSSLRQKNMLPFFKIVLDKYKVKEKVHLYL